MNLQLLNFPENITQEIKESLNNVLTSSFWSTGPQSQNLEQNFSEIYKRECISTSSGGTALQLLHDYFRNVKRIAIQSNTYFATGLPWINSNAENIPVNDNTFDYYSISYGIRNVSNINMALKEAFRVLKPGGRFMCLEFSKIDNEILNFLYKQYSKSIPYIGKLVVGSDEPYKYLVDSINKFYNQKELAILIKKNGFSNVEFRDVSNGISSIHSGWKI